MRYIGYILLILMAISCRSAKKTVSESASYSFEADYSETERLYDSVQQLRQELQTELVESIVEIGQVKIYPKGEFTLSPDGFKGEADSVVYSYNNRTDRMLKESVVSDTVSKITESEKSNTGKVMEDIDKSKTKDIKRNPTIVPYLGTGLAVAIVFLAVMFYIRKTSKFK